MGCFGYFLLPLWYSRGEGSLSVVRRYGQWGISWTLEVPEVPQKQLQNKSMNSVLCYSSWCLVGWLQSYGFSLGIQSLVFPLKLTLTGNADPFPPLQLWSSEAERVNVELQDNWDQTPYVQFWLKPQINQGLLIEGKGSCVGGGSCLTHSHPGSFQAQGRPKHGLFDSECPPFMVQPHGWSKAADSWLLTPPLIAIYVGNHHCLVGGVGGWVHVKPSQSGLLQV